MPGRYTPPSQRHKSGQDGLESGLGEIVKVFQPPSLEGPMCKGSPITNFAPLTSYSRLKSVDPTILVPGCPTYYKGFNDVLHVQPDEGLDFIDKSATLLPEAPLLPLYEAIKFDHPKHEFQQYNVVTGRGELKKLLSWVMQDQKKPFRIDIEKVHGKGVVLRRWEEKTIAGHGSNHKGYLRPAVHFRNNFEGMTCFPVRGNEDTFSYERVVSYQISGLRLLVQCEVDGFRLEGRPESFFKEHCQGEPKEGISDLAEALSNMTVKSKGQGLLDGRSKRQVGSLELLPYNGYEIGHEALIELKTRSARNPKPLEPSDIYAQAVWSGTPTTINAVHLNGVFREEEIYRLSELEELDETQDVRRGVKEVGKLLEGIISLLQDQPAGSKFCLISKGPQAKELLLRKGGRGAGLLLKPL